MELWIRSQDKETLVKANALYVMDNQIWNEVPFYENHKKIGLTITGHNHKLAQYKTKERALEVLDEIQRLIKNQYIVECKPLVNKEDANKLKKHFIDNYSGEFILQPPTTEIHPINPNVVVYEMPEK